MKKTNEEVMTAYMDAVKTMTPEQRSAVNEMVILCGNEHMNELSNLYDTIEESQARERSQCDLIKKLTAALKVSDDQLDKSTDLINKLTDTLEAIDADQLSAMDTKCMYNS